MPICNASHRALVQVNFPHILSHLLGSSPLSRYFFTACELPRGPDEGGGPGEIAAERPTAPLLAPFAAAEGANLAAFANLEWNFSPISDVDGLEVGEELFLL